MVKANKAIKAIKARDQQKKPKETRRKLPERFCSCIKKVWKSGHFPKESSAIAICVKSVIQGKGRRRTLKKFSCRGTPKVTLQQASASASADARR